MHALALYSRTDLSDPGSMATACTNKSVTSTETKRDSEDMSSSASKLIQANLGLASKPAVFLASFCPCCRCEHCVSTFHTYCPPVVADSYPIGLCSPAGERAAQYVILCKAYHTRRSAGIARCMPIRLSDVNPVSVAGQVPGDQTPWLAISAWICLLSLLGLGRLSLPPSTSQTPPPVPGRVWPKAWHSREPSEISPTGLFKQCLIS